MQHRIRWGILATGAVARDFAEGLSFVPGAELVAVGSRSQETADRFGDAYGVPRRYSRPSWRTTLDTCFPSGVKIS